MKLDIDWSKEPYIDSANLLKGLGFVKAVKDDTGHVDVGGLLIYYPVGFSLAEKFLRELSGKANISSVNEPAIEAEISTTHTAKNKDISVGLSEGRESKDKDIDETDKNRAEVKRLNIEYERNAGIYDKEDAIRSMAMGMEKIFGQLNALTEVMVNISTCLDLVSSYFHGVRLREQAKTS